MKLQPLNEESKRQREPLPIEELFDAEHDVIHRNPKIPGRVARTFRLISQQYNEDTKMTKNFDIHDLEQRVTELEARLAIQEARFHPEQEFKTLQEKVEFLEHELDRLRPHIELGY